MIEGGQNAMSDVDYLDLAIALPREMFVNEHAGHYLLKRPRRDAIKGHGRTGFGFATATEAVDFDPFAHQWQVMRVVKRPGNPFPELISVGRATNCDVVLRVPSVSKVQMHILRGTNGAFSLREARPSNPTLLNGVKLSPGEVWPLKLGDLIQFGAFEAEFVDADRLYDIIRAEAR